MANLVMLCLSPMVLSECLSEFFSPFHKSMKLVTLVQFGALNIVRYGAIAKMAPGGQGSHFTSTITN